LFESVGRYRHVGIGRDMNLTGAAEPARVHTTWAGASFFSTLGAQPAAGRFFGDSGKSGHAGILSFRLWRDRFGRNPNIVGTPIRLSTLPGTAISLDAQSFTVVGVLPTNFRLANWADIWLTEAQAGDETTNPVRHAFGVVARLKPGVSEQQVAARLGSI